MTTPINIYLISRICEQASFNIVAKHHSRRCEEQKTQYHEIESLRFFVNRLYQNGLKVSDFDGFFYCFTIPQIGKEFDLLKLSEKYCLNIELKSTAVPEEKILGQLLKNRYYLNHLGKRTDLYTVVTDTMTCYKLSKNDELIEVDLDEIRRRVNFLSGGYLTEIDNLFRPSKYLVSPLNTPAKFIRGEYFLTQAQENIKKELVKCIEETTSWAYFHFTGKPGTGKTLLLYDLAKTLSEKGRTLIIHCGKLSSGQYKIKIKIEDLNIISASKLKQEDFDISRYRFILVDESHRIYQDQYEKICSSIVENNQICVFASDPEQILSRAERERDIVGKIRKLKLGGEFELSEKIRSSREINCFITCMRNLNHRPKGAMDYANIQLCYANTTQEAANILEYYRNKGYVFINFSKSYYEQSPYEEYEEDFDTHHVIGQEFDKVVMLMDESFYYDENGILKGVPHPNPDYLYPNLFYQGVTRARENLAIVVVRSQSLFESIAGIVE